MLRNLEPKTWYFRCFSQKKRRKKERNTSWTQIAQITWFIFIESSFIDAALADSGTNKAKDVSNKWRRLGEKRKNKNGFLLEELRALAEEDAELYGFPVQYFNFCFTISAAFVCKNPFGRLILEFCENSGLITQNWVREAI